MRLSSTGSVVVGLEMLLVGCQSGPQPGPRAPSFSAVDTRGEQVAVEAIDN